MYKVIQNSQHLAEWMKSLPQETKVFDRNELIGKRLKQSVQCMDEYYGAKRDLKSDLGGFIIILYGSSCQIAKHYRKIMDYYNLNEMDYEYEDRYSEPERAVDVTFRLYLCSSDYAVEIVSIRRRVKSLECRLREGDWWQEGNECITLSDITKPPLYFEGDLQQWIEEITSYQYSYPNEWNELYRQYLHWAERAGNLSRTLIGFHRSEDGYLRKDGEREIYLKIKGTEPLPYDMLNQIGKMFSEQADIMLQSYLEYCEMDKQERSDWREHIKEKVSELIPDKELMVGFTETLDESAFAGEELYCDMLNRLYIIL